jgi:carboxyl-terminal processing protease
MKLISLSLLSLIFSLAVFAKDKTGERDIKRERIIGKTIRNALETYHYKDLKINDQLSKKALKVFFKKMDYSKQFLLASDVKKLKTYELELDDEMVSGDHKLLNEAVQIIRKRIKMADALREKYFKTQFTFVADEYLQYDPDKRDWLKNEKKFNDYWRKVYKQQVLSRYTQYLETKKDSKDPKKIAEKAKKDKKNKKKKKKKITKSKEKAVEDMTDSELLVKAHANVNKKYKRYFGRILKEDRNDHLEKFFNAITMVFDPHTNYLPPKRKEDFDIDISGQLEGIGAVLQEDGPYIKVVKIVPGGAAWRQKGLEVDDVILGVAQGDGEVVDLVDMRVDDAVRYIRGKKGTEVRLTVKKTDTSQKIIPIIRDKVQIDASYARGSVIKHKNLDFKVGYIHLPKFYRDFGSSDKDRNCTEDVRKEIVRLKAAGVNAMILDLRGNGGGALEDARKMSGLFIKKGPIVQIKSHTGQIETLADIDPQVQYGGPLIVMTNRFSASASEILAGALQDYGRAIIVGGEHSHGKGTVQAVLDLNRVSVFGKSMGALKVTIQKFYRITGASTQFKGVTPDIILPDPMAYTKSREQDLDNALAWDQVKPKKFTPWKMEFNLPLLKKRSGKRVKNDKRFQKIQQSVDYYTKRREDTSVTLNIKKLQKEDIESKKVIEKLKLGDENKDILVTDFEASIKAHQKIRKGDEAQWKKDFEQRKEDWVKSLQSDPTLEEGLYIIDDMLKTKAGKKLSMVKVK